MSYIITAEVRLGDEINFHGDIEKVAASILRRDTWNITFHVPGKFGEATERTLELCKTLIEAGFYSFEISHSY